LSASLHDVMSITAAAVDNAVLNILFMSSFVVS